MVTISEKAWKMGGSRMFIQVGTQVSVKDLLHGIIVASGNDACVAMAEHVAGTEDVFVQLMNQNAARLGMQNTHYTDSTGMPNPNHYSARRLIWQPSPERSLKIIPKIIRGTNNNGLYITISANPIAIAYCGAIPTVDGLKTGHTDEAGYCLVASALRNNMRLISVVLGTPSDNARTADSQALLNWGYRFFETHKLFNAQQAIDAKMQPRVWFGKNKYAKLGFAQDQYVIIPVNQFKQLQANIVINPKLQAPLIKGQTYGSVNVTLNGQPLTSIPVVALENDPKGNIFSRAWDHIAILFYKWFHQEC